MRGVISSFRRLAVSVVLLALLATQAHPIPVHAGSGLELTRDTVGSFIPGANNIYHEIYFVLPLDAQQVRLTDWILIDFPNYQNVFSDGAFLSGGFGTPSISQQGKQVQITNYSLLPGQGLTISGISATNPIYPLSTELHVKIAEGSDGILVHNQATIVPSDSRNSVSVTATVVTELSAVIVSGYTSASSFTTLTEGSSVLATTISDGAGFFTFTVSGIDPGNHSFRVFSTDSANRSTSQTSLNVFLLRNSVTTASGLLLSPSLSLSDSQIHAGDNLTIVGKAKPLAQVNVFLEAPLRSYNVTADGNGDWQYVVGPSETLSMSPGEYRVYAVTQDSDGNQSIVSPTVNFTVISDDDANNPPPACDISHGDLNCNGVTNLTDFSILLFHWNTNHRVADINSDGTVNLVDFSIMMFYYQ